MGNSARDPNGKLLAEMPRLDDARGRTIGLLRTPALKLARVVHAFVSDGRPYRLGTFHDSLASLADEELFEALRHYQFVAVRPADRSEDISEEEIHKGIYASGELQRRYALDLDLFTEKYLGWLDATGKEDPNWPPAKRELWREVIQHLREEERGALH